MIKYATGSRDVFANVVEDKEKAVEKEATTTMSASTPSLSQQNTQSKKEIPYEPLSIRGARGRVANSYGVKLSQYEVREITSNVPEALDLYNNGMRKRTAGMIIGIPATLFCLAGVITTWSNELSDWPDQDTRDIGTALTVVGVAIGIPSLITSSVGNKRIRQSVNAYNKGIKQAHTSDISLNFGITSSGGIGLVLNF